jgi:chromate transport protein ChrA
MTAVAAGVRCVIANVRQRMIYFNLFLGFLQIGLFSIGGGFATLPLIQNQVVDVPGWLTLEEFVDVIGIAEMTPGPIAVNSATFVGIKIAGSMGAVVATAGYILPSCIIVLLSTIKAHQTVNAPEHRKKGLDHCFSCV